MDGERWPECFLAFFQVSVTRETDYYRHIIIIIISSSSSSIDYSVTNFLSARHIL